MPLRYPASSPIGSLEFHEGERLVKILARWTDFRFRELHPLTKTESPFLCTLTVTELLETAHEHLIPVLSNFQFIGDGLTSGLCRTHGTLVPYLFWRLF